MVNVPQVMVIVRMSMVKVHLDIGKRITRLGNDKSIPVQNKSSPLHGQYPHDMVNYPWTWEKSH
jgi:hypothetical protein